MAENTPLVLALTSVGISPRRAEAFERLLDDHPFCGISGIKLGELVKLYGAKEAWKAAEAVKLTATVAANLAKAPVDLFQSSPYGTHASKRSIP